MLAVRKDYSPIINTQGEQKGMLRYSIEPIVYDENGEQIEHINTIDEMLGRDIIVEVKIHYAEGIPGQWSTNVFTDYKWIDVDGKTYKTKYSEDKKNKNPVWEYRQLHNVYVSSDFIERIKDFPLVMSVYGKLSAEDIEDLYEEYALDPAKNALLANRFDNSDEERKHPTSSGTNEANGKHVVGESKEIKEMKKRLEEMKKKHSKLKKEKVRIYSL